MYKTVGESLFGRRRSSKFNIVINFIFLLVILILVGELSFNLRYTCIWVDGNSMLPTIVGHDEKLGNSGEYVFADKTASPDYGDIVIVKRTTRNEEGKLSTSYIIKRVVALGGDTVKMEGGVLYLKRAGEEEFGQVTEDYISPEYNDPDNSYNSFEEHLVSEGMIFVLGDNRNISNDSRKHGDFSAGAVLGVVPKWSIKNKGRITDFFNFFNNFFSLKVKNSND